MTSLPWYLLVTAAAASMCCPETPVPRATDLDAEASPQRWDVDVSVSGVGVVRDRAGREPDGAVSERPDARELVGAVRAQLGSQSSISGCVGTEARVNAMAEREPVAGKRTLARNTRPWVLVASMRSLTGCSRSR